MSNNCTEISDFINFVKTSRVCYTKVYKDIQTNKNRLGWERKQWKDKTGNYVLSLTAKEAEEYLINDVTKIINFLKREVKVELTPNQFLALASLCYDIGIGTLRCSPILDLINDGLQEEAVSIFRRWNSYLGTPVYKYIKRRKIEVELYRSGIPLKTETDD